MKKGFSGLFQKLLGDFYSCSTKGVPRDRTLTKRDKIPRVVRFISYCQRGFAPSAHPQPLRGGERGNEKPQIPTAPDLISAHYPTKAGRSRSPMSFEAVVHAEETGHRVRIAQARHCGCRGAIDCYEAATVADRGYPRAQPLGGVLGSTFCRCRQKGGNGGG